MPAGLTLAGLFDSRPQDHATFYYVMRAICRHQAVKIDVTKGAVIDQKEYDKPFGLLTYDYEKAELYASESNGFDGDCVYRIDPATLEATELHAARRLGGLREWAAVDQAEEVVYLMAANMVNASTTTRPSSASTGVGKIVTWRRARLPWSSKSSSSTTLTFGAIVGMCSDVHARASTPAARYYLCSQDLTGRP